MKIDLSERILGYENAYDGQIIGRLPIIVKINAKNFTKITKGVPKPFCQKVSKAFQYAMFETIKQIDNAIFGYTKSDDIIIVLWSQNKDKDFWCNNKIQKICSSISSMITWHFQKYLITENNIPNITSSIIFETKSFAVPNITEVVNTLILEQHNCFTGALHDAAFAELRRKYDRDTAQKKIWSLKSQEKKALLFNECGIDFDNDYPSKFRVGVITYKAPKIIEVNNVLNTKIKWIIDENTPIFTKDRMFLIQILSTGSDIFRADRDLNSKID